MRTAYIVRILLIVLLFIFILISSHVYTILYIYLPHHTQYTSCTHLHYAYICIQEQKAELKAAEARKQEEARVQKLAEEEAARLVKLEEKRTRMLESFKLDLHRKQAERQHMFGSGSNVFFEQNFSKIGSSGEGEGEGQPGTGSSRCIWRRNEACGDEVSIYECLL